MSRSTTVRVVNTTGSTLTLDAATLKAGRWSGRSPSGALAPGATATFVNAAAGRWGSAHGALRYCRNATSIDVSWSNPFVGRNAYRMDVRGASGVVCDGANDEPETVVTYTVVPSRKVSVPGFLPSTCGFRFTNSWSGEPLKRIDLRIGTVPIGKASNGLCGGMAFAVRDWFEVRRTIPADRSSPPDRSPLREFVVDRLLDSYDLPGGVVPYATLMSTRYPDDDGDVLAAIGQVPSRASLLTRLMWPTVKATIDAGHPCPLGLVMVESNEPTDLRHQHQVLAYAYELRGTALTLWVYDPNSPLDDGITIAFDTSRSDRPVAVRHNVDTGGPLVCAFVPRYIAQTPPELS